MGDKRPGGAANGFHYVQPRRKIPKLDISIVTSGGSNVTTSSTAGAPSNTNVRPPVPKFVQPMMRSGVGDVAAARSHRNIVGNHTNGQLQQRPEPLKTSSTVRHHLPKQAPASDDMWGDEDEDFIMLASQVAENVENCGQNILVDSMDVSFGDFQRNRKPASCSTQAQLGRVDDDDDAFRRHRPNPAAPPSRLLASDFRTTIGGPNDDDDFMSELPDFDKIDNVDKHINEYLNNEQNTLARQFALSNGGGASAGNSSSGSGGGAGSALRTTHAEVAPGITTNTYMQSVENAREVQLKFLQSQLAARQSEAEQLQREVTKLNEQCQTKDGEVAMIRYDLQMNKKQQADLRQDKLNESERIKSEYAAKLVEMERVNLGHQSEMEFMRLELLNLKSRRPLHDHSTTSAALSTTNTAFANRPAIRPTLNDTQQASLFRLHLTEVASNRYQSTATSLQLFQLTTIDSNQPNTGTRLHKRHRPPNSLAQQLTRLQLLTASLTAIRSQRSSVQSNDDQLHRNIISVIMRSFELMANDCVALSTRRSTTTTTDSTTIASSRSDHIVHSTDDPQLRTIRRRLLDAESMGVAAELYDDESLRYGRRIVACVAAMVAMSWPLCELLFVANANDHSRNPADDNESASAICRLARIYRQIGMSARWQQYAGLVEAGTDLLAAVAAHSRLARRLSADLHLLLDSLLLCRPTGRALGRCVAVVRRLSEPDGDADFVAALCQHSGEFALVFDAPRRVQFGAASCPMQMLAVLMQIEWPRCNSVADGADDEVRLLADMTMDALRLAKNGVDRPVGWMVRMPATKTNGDAPVVQDDADDLCVCYAQLVCACVVLMHTCVKLWIERPKQFDLKTIIAIAQAGVIFVSDHFTVRYESLVLRVGGPAIKQRLHVTFAWFQQYQKVFLFERVHEQALQTTNGLRGVRHMFELLNHAATAAAEPPSALVASIWSTALSEVRALREAPEKHSDDASDDDKEPTY